MNYFTSDWHLGHQKMLNGLRGNIFSSVEEHDNTIINNIIETLSPGDNLFFLGDAFWKYSSKEVEQVMIKFKKHKINIHWILGNHDKVSWTKYGCVKWFGQMKDISIDKQFITLSHYPMLVYNKSHYSAWLLYGHIHKNDNTWDIMKDDLILENYLGKSLNVNVELYDYKPLSFLQIREILKDKPENFDLIKKNKKDE